MSSPKDLIIALPNKNLRAKSQRVNFVNAEVLKTIDQMKAATLDWESSRPHEVGVALAAIQIDKPYRVIIVRRNFDDKKDREFNVFINPKIVKFEGQIEEDYEGCLSVADIYGKVPRHSKIRLRALDINGREIRVKAEGFLARVLQHEADHTSGRLFVDHIKNKPEAFYKLTKEGKLVSLPHEELKKSHIFGA